MAATTIRNLANNLKTHLQGKNLAELNLLPEGKRLDWMNQPDSGDELFSQIEAWLKHYDDTLEISIENRETFLKNWMQLNSNYNLNKDEDALTALNSVNPNQAKYLIQYMSSAAFNTNDYPAMFQILKTMAGTQRQITPERYQAALAIAPKLKSPQQIESFCRSMALMDKSNLHLTGGTFGKGKDNLKKLANYPEQLPLIEALLTQMSNGPADSIKVSQARFDNVLEILGNNPSLKPEQIQILQSCMGIMQENKIPLKNKGNLAALVGSPQQLPLALAILEQMNTGPQGSTKLTQNRFDVLKEILRTQKAELTTAELADLQSGIKIMQENQIPLTRHDNLKNLVNNSKNLPMINTLLNQMNTGGPAEGIKVSQTRFNTVMKIAATASDLNMDNVIASMKIMQDSNLGLVKAGNLERLCGLDKAKLENMTQLMQTVNRKADDSPEEKKYAKMSQERFDALLEIAPKLDDDQTADLISCMNLMKENKLHFTGDKISGKGQDNLKNLVGDKPENLKFIKGFLSEINNPLNNSDTRITQERFDAVLQMSKNLKLPEQFNTAKNTINLLLANDIHLTGNKITGKGQDNLQKLMQDPDKIENVHALLTDLNKKKPGITQGAVTALSEVKKEYLQQNMNNIQKMVKFMQDKDIPVTGDRLGPLLKFNNVSTFGYMNTILSKINPVTPEAVDALLKHPPKLENTERINKFINIMQSEENTAKLTSSNPLSKVFFKQNLDKFLETTSVQQSHIVSVLGKMKPVTEAGLDVVINNVEKLEKHQNPEEVGKFIEYTNGEMASTQNNHLEKMMGLSKTGLQKINQILEVIHQNKGTKEDCEAIVKNTNFILRHQDKVDEFCEKLHKDYQENSTPKSFGEKLLTQLKSFFGVPVPIEKLLKQSVSTSTSSVQPTHPPVNVNSGSTRVSDLLAPASPAQTVTNQTVTTPTTPKS